MDILSTIIVSLLTSIIAMHIHMKLLEKRLIKFLDTQEKDSPKGVIETIPFTTSGRR